MAGHITLACIDIILLYDLPVYVLFISANAVNVFFQHYSCFHHMLMTDA